MLRQLMVPLLAPLRNPANSYQLYGSFAASARFDELDHFSFIDRIRAFTDRSGSTAQDDGFFLDQSGEVTYEVLAASSTGQIVEFGQIVDEGNH
ncbi:hypothetical protein EON67_12490, partial [archaeon]